MTDKSVVIYRSKARDIQHAFEEIVRHLKQEKDQTKIKIFKNGSIDVKNYHIDFFCGSIYKMSGGRPYLYNTDDLSASQFLMQSASKVNGIEIDNLEKLLKNILEDEQDGKKV